MIDWRYNEALNKGIELYRDEAVISNPLPDTDEALSITPFVDPVEITTNIDPIDPVEIISDIDPVEITSDILNQVSRNVSLVLPLLHPLFEQQSMSRAIAHHKSMMQAYLFLRNGYQHLGEVNTEKYVAACENYENHCNQCNGLASEYKSKYGEEWSSN